MKVKVIKQGTAEGRPRTEFCPWWIDDWSKWNTNKTT